MILQPSLTAQQLRPLGSKSLTQKSLVVFHFFCVCVGGVFCVCVWVCGRGRVVGTIHLQVTAPPDIRVSTLTPYRSLCEWAKQILEPDFYHMTSFFTARLWLQALCDSVASPARGKSKSYFMGQPLTKSMHLHDKQRR